MDKFKKYVCFRLKYKYNKWLFWYEQCVQECAVRCGRAAETGLDE